MAEKRLYNIPYKTYVKSMTGEKTENGYNKWATSDIKKGSVKNTTWKKLKQDAYNKAKSNKDVYVDFEDRFRVRKDRVLKSTTKTFADGHKEVTYYGK